MERKDKDRVPEKFLKHLSGTEGLYEIYDVEVLAFARMTSRFFYK